MTAKNVSNTGSIISDKNIVLKNWITTVGLLREKILT